ncbi:dUTP diphosphatase [Salmonella enterica subsp. enterica serovar Infantis]|nr:dUTP diphosphatase [Salmonella enterica subsp. enterica serovar Infantis]
MPKRASGQAAGVDLFAQEDMEITNNTELFELGFKAAVPEGYVGIIFPRSGLGAKFNCQLSNTLGVIDSDYRGQWMAALHLGGKGTKAKSVETHRPSHGETHRLVIKKGEAYAQVLFFEVPLMEIVQVSALNDTERGEGGFGSTTAPRA